MYHNLTTFYAMVAPHNETCERGRNVFVKKLFSIQNLALATILDFDPLHTGAHLYAIL